MTTINIHQVTGIELRDVIQLESSGSFARDIIITGENEQVTVTIFAGEPEKLVIGAN